MSNLTNLTEDQLAERFGVDFGPAAADLRTCLLFDSGDQSVTFDQYDDAVDRLMDEGFGDALEAMIQANVPTAKA